MQPDFEVVTPGDAEIQDAVRAADASVALVAGQMQLSVAEVIKAGRLLAKKKEGLGHGHWLAWLEATLPETSERKAQRWIKLAKKAETWNGDIEDAKNVTHALQLVGLLPEPGSPTPSSNGGGGALNCLAAAGKLETQLDNQIKAKPLVDWPKEELRLLHARLKGLMAIFDQVEAALA